MRLNSRLDLEEAGLSSKCNAVQKTSGEDPFAESEARAKSAMKLAMDTLDRSLEVVRATHQTAKRLRVSVEELDLQLPSV